MLRRAFPDKIVKIAVEYGLAIVTPGAIFLAGIDMNCQMARHVALDHIGSGKPCARCHAKKRSLFRRQRPMQKLRKDIGFLGFRVQGKGRIAV